MTRSIATFITVTLTAASLAHALYVGPAMTASDPEGLNGPADTYTTILQSMTPDLDDLEDMLNNPGRDTDLDGVTDLQEFLTGGDEHNDADGPERIEKFNLALALATDWTSTSDGDPGNDFEERLTQVFGTTTPRPAYFPGLSPTLETQFHKEIADLAASLGYDPVRIYEWVYANVEFEDYAFSRKGALSTLRTLRGNEWDQCSLLITLLRISGIPARYTYGQVYRSVEPHDDFAKDLPMVQAWLPVSHYRMNSDSDLDSDNRVWVPLAPWYKTTRLVEGIDLFPITNPQNPNDIQIPDDLDIRANLLIGRWEFEDDHLDTTADDLQGIHAGELNGNIVFSDDEDGVRPGKSAILPAGSKIQFPHHPDINETSFTKRTVSLWFKHTAHSPNKELIFGHGIVTSGLNIYVQDGILFVGSFNREINNDGHWVTSPYTPGKWHHVVLVLDAAVGLNAYLDGNLFGSTIASIIDPDHNDNAQPPNNNQLAQTVIGDTAFVQRVAISAAAPDTGTNVPVNGFIGRIDDVRILGSALSAEQVKLLHRNADAGLAYLTPTFNGANTSEFERHTQKTSVEYLEDAIQTHLNGSGAGASLKSVPHRWEIQHRPAGELPTTVPLKPTSNLVAGSPADQFVSDVAETQDVSDEYQDRRTWADIRVRKQYGDRTVMPFDYTQSYGLVGHWLFDESSGMSLAGTAPFTLSSGPNPWNGVVTTTDDWDPDNGIMGGALKFDGSTTSVELTPTYTTQPPPANLPAGNEGFVSYTVAMWVRLDPTLGNGHYILYEEGGADGGVALRLNKAGSTYTVQAAIRHSASVVTISDVTGNFNFASDGNWHHICLSIQGATQLPATLEFNLYRDAADPNISQISGGLSGATVPDHIDGGGIGVRHGASDAFNDSASNGYFKGWIDDVRVYRSVLDSDEVQAIHQAGLDTGKAPEEMLSRRVYLPQISGRRFMILPEAVSGASPPKEIPRFEIDGEFLDSADAQAITLAGDAYSVDKIDVSYRHRDDIDWTVRPALRRGGLVNITLDSLGASQARIAALRNELADIPFGDAFDTTTPGAQESYLGRLAALQSESFNIRSAESSSRTDDLFNITTVHHKAIIYNNTYFRSKDINSHFNMLWTYPEESDSLALNSSSDTGAFLVLARWRNDNHFSFPARNKWHPSTSLFHTLPNTSDLGSFRNLVDGHARSYFESRIFEDWQGTPALSTIGGIFAAIESGLPVKVYDDPGMVSQIQLDLENTGISQVTIDQIKQEVTAGDKVTVPLGPVKIKDELGTVIVQSDVRIVEHVDINDISIGWFFGDFNGSQSGLDFLKNDWLAFSITDDSSSRITSPHINPSLASESIFGTTLNTYNFDRVLATTPSVGDPVNPITGEFYLEEPSDISIRSIGHTLDITRRYGSRIIYNGPFGFGWGWSHAESLLAVQKDNTDRLIYYDATRRPIEITDNLDSTYDYPAGTTFTIEKLETGSTLDGYLIRHTDGREIEFHSDGRLKAKRDPLGNSLVFLYENAAFDARITTIRDGLNRELTLTYNDNGKVIRVTDFNGRVVRYGYDGDDLIWYEDLEGNIYRYEYLKGQDLELNNHNLSKQILPNGDFLEVSYYKNDTVSHHTNSNGEAFHFQYSWVNSYAETWNESGYYRKLFWNKNWDVIRILTEDKVVEHSEYDDNHNQIAQTDGNGNRTVFQYDNNRNLVSVTNPEGETQAFEYNSKRRVTKAYVQDGPITEDVLDPGNFYIDVIETESVYDTVATNTLLKEQHTATKSHRMAVTVNGVPILANHKPQLSQSNNITAPVKHVTLFDYDAKGNLVKVTEEVRSFDGSGGTLDNEITEHIYDVLGLNRVRTKDTLERFTNFTYDDLGRVITVTDPADFTTQVEYDAYGQPTRTVDSVGGVTLNEYDENRRLVKTTNAEGATSEVIYGIPFYGRNFERVTVETDPLGYTTRHEYDAVGDRIATTDANGNTTRFKYDELNRLIEATDALGNVTRNRYDGAGNLVETTDADENVVRLSYDKANRLVRRREMWREQRAVEFEYDERGNLTKEKRGYYYHEISANNWQIVDGTDADPVLQEPIVVGHEHDERNRRTQTTRYYVDETGHAGDRITELKYDSIGRLCVQIESGPTAVDGTGAPIAPDELRKTEFTYDKAGNITDQKVFAWDPNAIPDPDWEPNPASHIQHDYDDRNLLQATMVIDIDDPGYPTAENAYRQTNYTYDGNGRQKTATIDVGGTDRITETEYDAVGNVVRTRTRAGGTVINANEFTYNARNELVTSTNALGHTQSFTYDGNGNQVTATDGEGFTSRVFYDAVNRQVAVQDALGHTTTFEYDDLGNLTATTSPLGERTTSKYNKNNELIEQASPVQTSNAYVEDGIVPVEFIYDEYGRLIRTFDARPDGVTGFMQSEITYNKFDEPIKVIQEVTPLGGSLTTPTTITGYDGLGRVLLVKDALGNKTASEYDVLGRVLKLTQAVGTADETVSEYRYDPAGNRVTEVRASNGDPDTTDNEETNTTFVYDELNRLIETTVADHPVTPSEVLTSTVTYDDANRTVTTEDPFGVTQTTVSDLAGRRVSRATGGVVSSTWEYDRRGLVIRSDTPDDAAMVFEYDARGQLVRQIEAPGSAVEAVTRFKYDANGRQTRVTDPLGYVTQTDYDAAGRVVRTVEALGTADEAITKFHYDANGNLLSVIDANHISDFGKHRVEITAEEFQNEAVRYVYDELNRLTRTYDAGSRSDLLSRSVETVKYDLNGNAEETTLRDGRVIKRTFDALDRVTLIEDATDLNPANHFDLQTFAYDKQSRIKTASDTNIDLDSVAPSTAVTYTVEYTYDFAGRTKKEQGYDSTTLAGAQHGHAVEHIYTGINAGGVSLETAKKYYANTKTAPTTAQRTFTYERNMRGLLGSVKSGPTASVVESTYTYGDNARLTSMDMAGGDVTLGLVYDARGRESKRTYTATGSLPTPYTQTTTYDAASNVKNEAITDHYPGYSPSANHNYTYDAQHRLTGDDETIHPWPASTWTYDAVGNWETTNQNLTTASAVDLTANDDNEYTGVDGVPHTYDARGNLVHVGDPAAPADGDRRYAYDWNNRLIRAEVYNTSGGWAVQGDYQYDARNRRTSKKAGAYLTVFAYDGSRVAFELHGTTPANATLTRSYAYNAYVDSPLLMIDEDGSAGTGAGRKFHYLHDRRHSVVALTDGAGGVFEQYRYSAFGRWTVARGPAGFATPVYHQSPAQNPYGYTGRRYDAETATANGSGSGGGDGLWHYRNRMYAATLGRFLQRDPAGYVDGYNLYAYVRNNPLGFVDAMGLSKQYLNTNNLFTPAISKSSINNVVDKIGFDISFGGSSFDGITQWQSGNFSQSYGGGVRLPDFSAALSRGSQPQRRVIEIGARTEYGQRLDRYFPEYTQSVADAYVARERGLALSRLQRSEIASYEERFARGQRLAQKQIYQDREFGSSIGGRLLRGADTLLNPAYDGLGNINDATVILALKPQAATPSRANTNFNTNFVRGQPTRPTAKAALEQLPYEIPILYNQGFTPNAPVPELIIRASNGLGFETRPNDALFWSNLGPGNSGVIRSQAYAREYGGTTLEMTRGGRFLQNLDLYSAGSPVLESQVGRIWDNASMQFANQASGQARVLLGGGVRPGSTYGRIERPALTDNPNVTGLLEFYINAQSQIDAAVGY